MHVDWFFHVTYDLLEDKRIGNVSINNFSFFIKQTNRFHVAVALYSCKSQKMSEHARTSVTHWTAPNLF